jgi:phosphoribosylanthranilate isomerase
MRTRVKFCGITRADDAWHAAMLGADAIGLVFYPPSPRAVTLEQAQAICRGLPPFVSRVGLFVDADPGRIEEAVAKVPLDTVQFHGEESPEVCARCPVPVIKALRVAGDSDLPALFGAYDAAAAILLDSYHRQLRGGTGETFDWSQIPQARPRPLILAGGLTPDNVAAAVQTVRPYGVDVSSGVEYAPGQKDHEKMTEFFGRVDDVE